jgi:hypothetical protein
MTERKIHAYFIGVLLGAMMAAVNTATLAQQPANVNETARNCGPAASAAPNHDAAVRLAGKARQAFGGEKFAGLASLKIKGTGQARSPLTEVELDAQFRLMATESQISVLLSTPIGLIQLIHDGQEQTTMVDNMLCAFGLGPQQAFSLWALAKADRPGRRIESVPGGKPSSFRVTDESCKATDFEIDPATGFVKELTYVWNGLENRWRMADFRNVDGVLIPHWIEIQLGSREGNYFVILKAEQVELNGLIKPEIFKPLGN